ncbi:MAG: hypothetical protein PHW82_11740 [Bacteroidales bacterium]|nr:hypothetical protein [Bacteroidales bacterium]
MDLLQEYNLPDKSLFERKKPGVFIWQPNEVYVILGQRDNVENAVEVEVVKREKAVVMQRPSGGHAVVLTPNTLIVSLLSREHKLTAFKTFFYDCNMKIIKALEKQGVNGLNIQGVSDVVLNGKKIVGSSMYRGKDFLFFHAVINIAEDSNYIDQFLRHPKTEPEYRRKRKHSEFITSLNQQGYMINLEILRSDIKNNSVG